MTDAVENLTLEILKRILVADTRLCFSASGQSVDNGQRERGQAS